MVRLWTISAEAGLGGRQVAVAVAEALDIPMLDRAALLELSGDGETLEQVDDRLHGRLQTLGLVYAAGFRCRRSVGGADCAQPAVRART